MSTVKLTGALTGDLVNKAIEPANRAIASLVAAMHAEPKVSLLRAALYNQVMPKEHRAAWETLPRDYLRGEDSPKLSFYILDHATSINIPPGAEVIPAALLQRPLQTQAFFNEYIARSHKELANLEKFEEHFPSLYEVISTELKQIQYLVTSRDALILEIKAACSANVTLNRLLKVVPSFEKYVPIGPMTALRKPRGMVSSTNNGWTPGQLKSAMLVTDITTA